MRVQTTAAPWYPVSMAAKSTVQLVSTRGRTRVKIVADHGSTVKNIVVGGRRVDDLDGWRVEQRAGWVTVLGRLAFYLACFLFCMGVWGAVFWAFERLAFGQSTGGQCELIKNVDQRHYCRACWQQGKQGECELIKDRDLRYQCRAQCKSQKK